MASRCTVQGAPRVIWSIKASAQFNSDCAFALREGFRSNRIRLLIDEYDVDDCWKLLKPVSLQQNTEQVYVRMRRKQKEDAGWRKVKS